MMSRTATVRADSNEFRLASVSKAESSRNVFSRYQNSIVNGTMVVGAMLLAGSGAIHLHLWLSGYRAIHVIGPLFMAQAISAFGIALAVVVLRRATAALAGTALLAGTIAGLLMSSWHGIFGFHDSLTAPYAGLSLWVEGAGIAALVLASVGRYRLLMKRRRESHTKVIRVIPAATPWSETLAPVKIQVRGRRNGPGRVGNVERALDHGRGTNENGRSPKIKV